MMKKKTVHLFGRDRNTAGFTKATELFLCLLFGIIPAVAPALTVSEDFGYRLNTGDTLVGANGGAGWDGAWKGNEQVLFRRDLNLAYSSPVQRSRREESQDSGSLYSQTSNHRAIYRNLAAPVSGEIWFSYLFRTGGSGSGGLMFNATEAHTLGGGKPSVWNVLLDSSDAEDRKLKVTINGTTTLVKSGLAGGANDYFVLGRIVTGKEGVFQLWMNPKLGKEQNLAAFTAAPDFSDEKAVNPDSLVTLGIIAYKGRGGSSVFRFDSLRLSDGDGNAAAAFADVAGFFQ